MKKSLFLLGVAAAVFSGCSNQEVMDVAEYANQPIEFTTFVDKMENIKSLDPLLYSHLTHQKYIRIK